MKSIKNTDYVIYMSTKRGSTYAYLKEHDSWTQTAPTGVVRKATAEQVLNHLLPALSGDQLVSVKVERKSLYKGAGRDTGGTPKGPARALRTMEKSFGTGGDVMVEAAREISRDRRREVESERT